jgi:hypothetical protein
MRLYYMYGCNTVRSNAQQWHRKTSRLVRSRFFIFYNKLIARCTALPTTAIMINLILDLNLDLILALIQHMVLA